MSPILITFVTALGGLLAGLAAAGPLIWSQQQALTRARHDATHDDTTDMPNRRALLTRLRRALRDGDHIAVVLLDLDGFKRINDTFGHDAGNDVLTAVGQRLSALGAPVLLAARLSGDEFALLVRGDTTQAAAVASGAWRAVSRDPVRVRGQYVQVQASVGHATAGAGTSPRELLHAADMAMYEAKQSDTGVCAATTRTSRLPRNATTRYRDLPRH